MSFYTVANDDGDERPFNNGITSAPSADIFPEPFVITGGVLAVRRTQSLPEPDTGLLERVASSRFKRWESN